MFKYPKLTSYEIANKIQKREKLKRFYIESLEEHIPNIHSQTERGRKEIQKVMSRWKKTGFQIMDNVCEGKFP